MNNDNKWSSLIDYFLLLGAIVGVGFASGKEVVNFFIIKGNPMLALVVFTILYIFLFMLIEVFKNKLHINTYQRFSELVFSKYNRICSIIMIINFGITSAGMLASSNYLCRLVIGCSYPICAIALSIFEIFILLRGSNGLKLVSNIVVPVMLIIIVVNLAFNIGPVESNVISNKTILPITFGLIFGLNNFISAIPLLVESSMKTKGKLVLVMSIGVIVLLSVLVLVSNNYTTSMPLLELSKRMGGWFYTLYFVSIIFALLTTYMVCSQNIYTIIFHDQKSIFGVLAVVLSCLIVSNLGFEFIVRYLYLISGIISGIMVSIMVISITITLLRMRSKSSYNRS